MIDDTSLGELQSDEHRRVLDIVAQLRKCGLESVISLPQIVACGDQSSGKSSTLEAITGIPFEQSDNLCTRFATEIHLRDSKNVYVTVRVIPDPSRPAAEQATIKNFEESFTDFADLPRIMTLAKAVMGIEKKPDPEKKSPAFARDVLSIEFGSPGSPQLTVVDIPGLIATSTKGVTKADVELVAAITDHYINQPRTICLAVVSATNDYSNQRILEKVRDVDPEGERTLGVITKPDGLASGSASEAAYIELARNEDIFFKLGWHVLKNRKFEESGCSLEERNLSEATFFNKSNFKTLPQESVGIDALKARLAQLLFEHIKNELPKLRKDLETALEDAQRSLGLLGSRRSTAVECTAYLSRLSMNYHRICLAAIGGHYEDTYFQKNTDQKWSLTSPTTVARTRAVVQFLNTEFTEIIRERGHKYQFSQQDSVKIAVVHPGDPLQPICLTKNEGLEWVRKVLVRTRGKELVGNFNPLLIGELFWEQSERWADLAGAHVEKVSGICSAFLKNLIQDQCPKDVANRVWGLLIEDKLRARMDGALKELALLVKELRLHPINYNKYYTQTVSKSRVERQMAALAKCVEDASVTTYNEEGATSTSVDVSKAVMQFSQSHESNMDDHSCQEALDCLLAIYKVHQKTFIANVTTQVIERHIVGELEEIFSPVIVSDLSDAAVENMASEPAATKRTRAFLEDRTKKLKEGQEIFKRIM
ncbi:dynamin family protein-like protein [Bisporella sp. PMI_857]|nr:dynamin family protein-like protein [Bisporella sp. PMI_857]